MDGERNPTMVGGSRLKLAVFGANCSSGRAATTVPERWQNTFAEKVVFQTWIWIEITPCR